jgi:uncharacterized protein (TIGR02270 family)
VPSAVLSSPVQFPSLVARDPVLWDVVEEHVGEAAFGLEQFERALEHPRRTLSELDRHPEGRLRAHLDALVIGGAAVRERVLLPELENPDEDEPARVTAAAIPLIQQGNHEDLWPALANKSSIVRDAAVRATSLQGTADLDRWATTRLPFGSSAFATAGLLQLHAARGLGASMLHKWLRSEDPGILAAAAHAARWADPGTHRAAVEDLLQHPHPLVKQNALVSSLCLGSRGAQVVCERWALEGEAPPPLVLALAAALGSREFLDRLAGRLDAKCDHAAVLFALAFSGDSRQIPRLIEILRSKNQQHAKLAFQAIAAITGLDLRDDAFSLSESEANAAPADPDAGDVAEVNAALPLFEDDDLGANLVPQPEDALPRPNPDVVERFWKQRAGLFDPSRRYLAGFLFGTDVLMRQLEYAPLRLRHVLALTLCIRIGPTAWVDTRAWSATQRARIAAVRKSVVAGSARSIGRE